MSFYLRGFIIYFSTIVAYGTYNMLLIYGMLDMYVFVCQTNRDNHDYIK